MNNITSTDLERVVDAVVATLAAWCYPSDVEVRSSALEACGLIGVDYIGSIAHVMDNTRADAHTARYIVAANVMDDLVRLRKAGATPRVGILATGAPADGLGRSAASYPQQRDDDDYGSLA